jgi:CRISPR-associated protein Csh1
MIKTIYEYGVHLQHLPDTQHQFSIFNPPYFSRKADENLIYYANIQNKKFIGLKTEAYHSGSDYLEKYIFRGLSSANAAPMVPSLHFYFDPQPEKWAESIEKFKHKLARCLEANRKIFNKYFDTETLMTELPKAFNQLKELEKRNYFFTLKFEDDQYLGDIPEIKALLETGAYDKYFKSKDGFYKATDKLCAITYQQMPEVWGRVDTLGFTVNDIPFSRNGFNAKDSYKMFPVAPEVVKVLEGTMNILESDLAFNFSNLRFFVLPHFIAISDAVKQAALAERFYEEAKASAIEAKENARTLNNLAQTLVNTETIFTKLQEGQKDVYYDIFFYEQKQAQFAIKLHVSDVLPSRFRAILEAKRFIQDRYYLITRKTSKEKKEYSYYIRFAGIKDYFAIKTKTDTLIEPVFYKIVEAVFYQNPLNETQILKAFMAKIVIAFKSIPKEGSFAFEDHVKQSFCIHQFFQTLQLFGAMKQNSQETQVCLNAPDFVAQHQPFFGNEPLKTAAFYLGCATEVLLTAQRKRLDSEPFAKKLNNLQIGYKELQAILSKLMDKAKAYEASDDLYVVHNQKSGVLVYSYLHDLIYQYSLHIMKANPEMENKTVISFAFSLGLVMEKEFTRERAREGAARKAEKAGAEVKN